MDISLNNGKGYMPEFIGNVPDQYIGKQVVFTEDMETKEGIRTNTQRITARGLDPLVASTSWKV